MRWIDFEGRTPTDNDIPGWTPWTQKQWQDWLATARDHLRELVRLHRKGMIKARNEYIDKKSAHWGKLKPWLLALSHNKCWFSDTGDTFSHYDVEHFRPKKEAKDLGHSVRDGYWWLAFEYSNYRICGNVGNRKKGGWFPLRDKSLCSTFDCQCEESETRYLLDPTDPEDVGLVAFDEEGNLVPHPDCDDWERIRVDESLTRLKLNEHEALVEARRQIWQKMSRKIERYLSVKARCSSNCNPGAEAELRRILREIKEMLKPEVQLSSVAKWCILFRNDRQLMRFVA